MTIPVATRAGRPFDGTRRLLTRLAVLVLLMLATGIGLAGPAAAHNVLISSDPADGSTLQTAPTTVRLTFDQPVQNFEPVVTVLGPDGQRYESGTPQVDSNVVTNTIGALPSAGAYSIAYRIVSADGHPVEGQIRFELAPGAAGIGSGAAGNGSGAAVSGSVSGGSGSGGSVSGTAGAAGASGSSSGLTGWVWAAIAVAAILVIAAIFVIVRRPRQSG